MKATKKLLITAALLAAGFAATTEASAQVALGGSVASARINGGNFDSDNVGWKAFAGGYSQYVGIEGSYIDFGELGGPNNPNAHAWVPAVTVGIPIDVVNIYGKIGEAFYHIDSPGPLLSDIDDNKIMWGVGVRAGKPTGLGVRVEYERFKLEDAKVDLISAGLEFRF